MTAWPTPKLDTRTPDDIYRAALAAARASMPAWAYGFGADPDYFDRADVGLVMFKLFGELFQKLSTPLNGVPAKYALAFWDFLGVTLRAPKAAEAPIAFAVSGGAAAEAPKGSKIIALSAPGVVFETLEDLTVLPLTIAAAYGVRPAADAYADFTGQVGGQGAPFSLFADAPDQVAYAHGLFLSDDTFDFAGQNGALTLTIEGANLYPRYFAQWTNAAGETLNPEFTERGYDTLTLTFANLPDLPQGQVDGVGGAWIGVAPAAGVRIVSFLSAALPQIYSIAAKVALVAIAPDKTFFNSQSVDLKKGGRPFGTAPGLQDAFYIGSSTAFSRVDGQMTLDFTLEPIVPPEPVQLAWEFWNGTAWQGFEVVDGTANFTKSGQVTFTCPQITPTAVNNTPSSWIRVRIADGGYGAKPTVIVTESATEIVDDVIGAYIVDKTAAIAALQKQGINFGYAYQPATFTPPFIQALQIDCVTVKRPDQTLTLNGFGYAPLATLPYAPPTETVSTFYLGLDARNFATAVAGQRLTLFFAPVAALAGSDLASRAAARSALRLSYQSSNGWTALQPVRRGGQLSGEGILDFEVPADFPPAPMFGQTLRWLRIEQSGRAEDGDQSFTGVFVNVMAAFNAVTQTGAILGSSTGAPSQTFAFPQKPVLEGPVVEVYEPVPIVPSPDEADVDGPPPEDSVAAGASNIKQAWVRWRERSNFDFSTPTSRHYVLDHTTGLMAFGDGLHGAIPPKGSRNIKAAFFQSGGGVAGNLPAGALSTLQKSIPAIASVTNVMAAVGGVAADQVSGLPLRAPGEVRSQNRAVTTADFATLALSASQDVARATCIDETLGPVRVVLLPNDAGQTPAPSFGLISDVGDYLRQRALPVLAPLITVGGPDYLAIDADISIILASGAAPDTVQAAITAAYAGFLNPLTGGPTGLGWSFGGRVAAASVASLMASVAGVAMVDGVSLGNDQTAIQLGADQLPAPGTVKIELVDANSV